MKRSRLILLALLIGLIFYLTLPEKPSEDFYLARVKRIIDGDSILVAYQGEEISLRLSGIDAPEYGDDYAAEAADKLRAMLGDEGVIYFIRAYPETDIYQRWLVYGYPKPPGDIHDSLNAALVRQGLAVVPDYPDRSLYYDELKAIEEDARRQGLGLHQLE